MNAPGLKNPMDQRMAEIIDGDSRGGEWFQILGICEEAKQVSSITKKNPGTRLRVEDSIASVRK